MSITLTHKKLNQIIVRADTRDTNFYRHDHSCKRQSRVMKLDKRLCYVFVSIFSLDRADHNRF